LFAIPTDTPYRSQSNSHKAKREKHRPNPPALSPAKGVVVLCAMPETGAVLGEMLGASAWNVRPVHSCREGFELLSAGARAGRNQRLRPRGWRLEEPLERMKTLPHAPPPLIVTSRHADESLWTEVLSLNGYDVLAQPEPRSTRWCRRPGVAAFKELSKARGSGLRGCCRPRGLPHFFR
jgi:hypothetical protein